MNQEKVGQFIATLRKENKLTQEQLAEKLNVTSKSVSRWENGKTLPDYSLISILCDVLKISINELFSGEKINEENFKEKADNNLLLALENSSFTLKDKIKYYKSKWIKEHIFTIILSVIVWLVICILLKFQNVDGALIGAIAGLLSILIYTVVYNRMMIYVENNAYKKIEKQKDGMS